MAMEIMRPFCKFFRTLIEIGKHYFYFVFSFFTKKKQLFILYIFWVFGSTYNLEFTFIYYICITIDSLRTNFEVISALNKSYR